GVRTTVSEVFDPRTDTHARLAARRAFPLYPRLHLAADGTLFFAGGNGVSPGFWSPFAGNAYRTVPGLRDAGQRNGATSCFFGDVRNQNLLMLGGGWPAT